MLDLADYRSVLSFGARVRSELSRLDIFIANAGVEFVEFDMAEGLERTLTVNVVSTILGAMSILPKLEETSRVFNTRTNLSFVGSSYHIFGPQEDLELPRDVDIFDGLSKADTARMELRYALSKLMLHQCQVEFAALVSRRNKRSQNTVVVNVVNPGWCKSEISRSRAPPGFMERATFLLIGWTGEKGSRVIVYAATMGAESHSRYITECELKSHSEYMRSEEGMASQKRVWKDLMARLERLTPEVVSFIR